MQVQFKQETVRLMSRYPNGEWIYSKPQMLTWIKPPFMPWLLAAMEEIGPESASDKENHDAD